jgi:hypothetical protein
MPKRRPKRPAIEREPRVEKKIYRAQIADDNEGVPGKTPVWRLWAMDMEGLFGWGRCAEHLLEIREKMCRYEQMMWREIEGDRHRNHFLSPESLSPEAQRRLVEIDRDDVADSLFSLHVDGEKRIVGWRVGREYRLLWWDPDHRVSPSRKR